jgi:hypothetical protein
MGFAFATSASAHTAVRTQASHGQHVLSGGEGFYEIDLNAYCKALGYPGLSPYLQEYDVYGWRCVDWSGNLVQFDMHNACRWSMNSDFGADRVSNFYDPLSVRCFKGSEAGSPDLFGYCQSRWMRAQIWGGSVYDWWCIDAGGGRHMIDFTDACRWQFGDFAPVARFDYFYQYDTWQCWGFGLPV